MRELKDLERLAASTHGLVTLEALRAADYTDRARRSLLRSGVLVPAGTRAYRVIGAPDTPHRRLLEACLDVGGWASHRSALGLQALPGFRLDDPVEVLVRKSRHSTSTSNPATVLHVTRGLPARDLTVVDGIPTVSLARSLVDLAGLVPLIDTEVVIGAVENAVRLHKAPER